MSSKNGGTEIERLSGGDMLLRALQDSGVEYIFGYPGGSALHIYDAIFRQKKIQHILVRHEQGATHMADAYARSTGKIGVVLVTSGPGATNAITPCLIAYQDSVPVFFISGQVHHKDNIRNYGGKIRGYFDPGRYSECFSSI